MSNRKDHDPNTGVKPPGVPQGRSVTPQAGGGLGEGTSWAFPTDGGRVKLPDSVTGGIPRDAGASRMTGSAGELARGTQQRADALAERVRAGLNRQVNPEDQRRD
jgi:hypothetical protein